MVDRPPKVVGFTVDRTRRILTTDELRNAIENLGAEPYENLSYYERWMAALMNILEEKGLVTKEQVEKRMAEIRLRLGINDPL